MLFFPNDGRVCWALVWKDGGSMRLEVKSQSAIDYNILQECYDILDACNIYFFKLLWAALDFRTPCGYFKQAHKKI